MAQWKNQARDGSVDTFSSKAERKKLFAETKIKELHVKIGQLTVERDFLTRAFGR